MWKYGSSLSHFRSITLCVTIEAIMYWVLAYYKFVSLENPEIEVKKHRAFLSGRNITCRIYLSQEGINGQMSGAIEDAKDYIAWLRSDSSFRDIEFKIHTHHEQVFPRVTVKVRSQLVALDKEVDIAQTGTYLSPQEWCQMMEGRDDETVILDVRNDYEWEVGHFEGAKLPKYEQFREFPQYAKNLSQTYDVEKTKMMMYCTGGIRCELYSALLKQEGFKKVYQLRGGVIQYGLEEGSKHWKGRLFVFDDRLCIPLSKGDSGTVISSCCQCGTLSDLYYNCANMDCNELFISCSSCAEKMGGCCSSLCQKAPRVRAFEKRERPRPFRRQAP